MYIVKEIKKYQVIDSENYAVVKQFDEYEKAKADEFANTANSIVANEQQKEKREIARLNSELDKLKSVTLPQ